MEPGNLSKPLLSHQTSDKRGFSKMTKRCKKRGGMCARYLQYMKKETAFQRCNVHVVCGVPVPRIRMTKYLFQNCTQSKWQKKKPETPKSPRLNLVAEVGLEPTTYRVWTDCSSQLSYSAIWNCQKQILCYNRNLLDVKQTAITEESLLFRSYFYHFAQLL